MPSRSRWPKTSVATPISSPRSSAGPRRNARSRPLSSTASRPETRNSTWASFWAIWRTVDRVLDAMEGSSMADKGLILVTGAAGQLGAVGRTVCGLLLDRGFPVRAMVRREDDRAAALRAAGAEVVVGDLLEPADVYRVVSGCRRV